MTDDNNYNELLENVCKKINDNNPVKTEDILEIKSSIESIENLITDTQSKLSFQEIKEKLESVSLQIEGCNEAVLKDLYNDLNELKNTSLNINQYLENINNVQNLALTSAEFEEYQKQQLDLALKTNENVYNELKEIKTSSKNTGTQENIKQLESQLNNIHQNLSGIISTVISKIDKTPNLDDIGTVVADLNSVQQKSIKQTSDSIKELRNQLTEFQSEFKNKDFENQITKISEIYESLNIINTWIEKVGYINKSIENVYARLGENIDFDDVSEKVDIIYENISALNVWTAKIDNIDSSAKEMEDKLSYLVQADNSEKISDIKDKVNSINDAVSEEKIDDIKNKIDSISKSVSEDKVDYIKNKVDSISKSVSEDKVDYIKNKVENIHNSVSEERISNIQDKISELGKYLEETKNISNILYDVKNRLDSSLSEEFDFDDLANKMDIVYENLSAINEWASKIDSIQDKISQLNLVFENGSIESKIDVIYENIAGLNQWANKLDSISKQSEDLDSKYTLTSNNLNIKIDELSQTLENANQIISDIPDIKEKLSELSGELHAITSQTKTDTDSYIYTLLDIESDFLKMHKYMEDNTKITSGDINALKERFSELNDDISSISIRTNKLILSADDANKEFKECLQEFKSALLQLDEQKNAFNPELKYELVAEKISGLTSLLQNIVITNKNLNSAFVYTAEWIDAAGSILNSVQNDLVLIKKEIETVNKNAAENVKDIKALIQADLEKEEFNPEEITNSINNEITAITDKIDALQNVFTELKIDDKICAITDRINEIENVFTELKLDDKICALTDRIDELENAFVSLKTDDISELKSVITGVIVQLNTALKPDIDSLNEKIEKLTENNNNKFTELETLLQEKVDFQGKKIENLENKINEMSSKFDKLVEVMGEDQKAFEIKDVLNYIASQIAGVNEKINEQQRHGNELINEMSEKLNGFNDDINKIVSYIEEE